MPHRSQRHLREIRGKDSRGTLYTHPPTNITLSNSTITAASAIGTAVGNLTTTDADVGQTFLYYLDSNPSGFFKIVGNQLQKAAAVTAGSRPVTIRSTDNKGGHFSKAFTITVT